MLSRLRTIVSSRTIPNLRKRLLSATSNDSTPRLHYFKIVLHLKSFQNFNWVAVIQTKYLENHEDVVVLTSVRCKSILGFSTDLLLPPDSDLLRLIWTQDRLEVEGPGQLCHIIETTEIIIQKMPFQTEIHTEATHWNSKKHGLGQCIAIRPCSHASNIRAILWRFRLNSKAEGGAPELSKSGNGL